MGIELAKAYVTVRGDNSKLAGDLRGTKRIVQSQMRSVQGSAMLTPMGNKGFGSAGGRGKAIGAGLSSGLRMSGLGGSFDAMGLGAGGGMSAGSAALTAGTAAVVIGLAAAGKAGEEFNQKMNNSLSIMGELGEAMRSDLAMGAFEAARVTKFSASEAAEAYFFLASAGLDAVQSLKAMPQVAQFAQAGNFDLALATDLATDAQSALGLTVKDPMKNLANLARVTDVLVKANTLANASVQQFSEAITNKAGASAAVAGMEIEELTSMLAAFADRGIKGAEAGTAAGIVLRDLQTKAIKNRTEFRNMGIAVFDSAGNLNNIADIIGQLESKMSGMSAEQKKMTLQTLGFSDKSVAFTQVLLGTSEQMRRYQTALADVGGITQEVASKQLTPLQKGTAEIGSAFTKVGTIVMSVVGPIGQGIMTGIAIPIGAASDTVLGFFEVLGDLKDSVAGATGLKMPPFLEWFRIAAGMNAFTLHKYFQDDVVPAAEAAADSVGKVGDKVKYVGQSVEEIKAQQDEWQKHVEKSADTVDKMNEKFKSTLEGLHDRLDKPLTPLQQFEKDLKEINMLYDAGNIALGERNALIQMAEDKMMEPQREEEKKRAEEAKQAEEDRIKGLKDDAKSLFNDTRTPFEQMQTRLSNILTNPFVDPQTRGRALFQERMDIEQQKKELRGGFGTGGGFTDIGRQIQEKILRGDETRKQLDELMKHSMFLERIEKKLGLNTAAVAAP